MWRVVVAAVLVVANLAVVPGRAVPVSAGPAAEDCVVHPFAEGGGTYTGDCRFVQDFTSEWGCNVDTAQQWYSPGCVPANVAGAPSASPRPSPPAGFEGCDYDPATKSWWGPGCELTPGDGYKCRFIDTQTGAPFVVCDPPGPPPSIKNCVADGQLGFTCDAGDVPPPPQDAPPCGQGNLICNGDFSVGPDGSQSPEGKWFSRPNPGGPSACNIYYVSDYVDQQYTQVDGRFHAARFDRDNRVAADGYWNGRRCDNDVAPFGTVTWQRYQVNTADHLVRVSFDVSWGAYNAPGVQLVDLELMIADWSPGWVEAGYYWLTCDTLTGGITWDDSEKRPQVPAGHAGHVSCTLGGNHGPRQELYIGHRLSWPRCGPDCLDHSSIDIDNVVVTPIGDPLPPEAEGGGWSCPAGGPGSGACEPPEPSRPGFGGCAWDDQVEAVVCQQLPEGMPTHAPGPSPAPSGSPSAGPSAGPSANPSAYPSRPPSVATPVGIGPVGTPRPGGDDGRPCKQAMQLLAAAIAQGIPYCWGSRDPTVQHPVSTNPDEPCLTGYGLDCSGMVIYAWRAIGVEVPDLSAQGLHDALPSTSCTLDQLGSAAGGGACWEVGDLVFLGRNGGDAGQIYHVAAYMGGGLWGDCYSADVGCVVWPVDGRPEYRRDFAGAARPSLAWGGGRCGDNGPVGGEVPGGTGNGGGVGTALAALANIEPVGTLLDTARYMRTLGVMLVNPDTSAPELEGATADNGSVAGMLRVFSGAAAWSSLTNALNFIADRLDAARWGGLSLLLLIRMGSTVAAVFLLFRYVRARVQLVA